MPHRYTPIVDVETCARADFYCWHNWATGRKTFEFVGTIEGAVEARDNGVESIEEARAIAQEWIDAERETDRR